MSTKTCGTPVVTELLLHSYYRCEAHPNINTPAFKDAATYLKKEGLIQLTDKMSTFETTPRGTAHVRQLCDLPFPRETFVDQNGKEIKV